MARLVESFVACDGDHKPIREYREALSETHEYLTRCGVEAVRRAATFEAEHGWGTWAKRVRAPLPYEGRSEMIGRGLVDHNLVEVINQCATIERLLGALEWAQSEPSLQEYVVERCHPTTGRVYRDAIDNDLVLVRDGGGGRRARFEVSDVIGRSDGNKKEKRDLANLGVLTKQTFLPVESWPADRLFLTVSEEFGDWLTRDRIGMPSYRLEPVGSVGTTVIVEVSEGEPT